MGGVILRLLFAKKMRTQNPIYLLLMSFVGILASLPLAFGFAGFFSGDFYSLVNMIILSPYWLIGLALLTNAYLSFFVTEADQDAYQDKAFF